MVSENRGDTRTRLVRCVLPLVTLGVISALVAAYGSAGSAFTYDVQVSTDTPGADLTLTFGGTSGSFGGAIFSGYTVTSTVIPEPGTFALFGLAGLGLLLRRRTRG